MNEPYEPDRDAAADDATRAADANEIPPAETEEPLPGRPAVLPNFCPACGAVWQAEWGLTCQPCRLRRAQPIPLTGTDISTSPIKSAVGLYFALLFTNIMGVVVSAALSPTDNSNNAATEIVITIVDTCIVLVWLVLQRGTIAIALRQRPHVGWLFMAVGLAFVTFGVAQLLTTGLVSFFGVQEIDMGESFREAGYSWVGVILCVCLQPAIIEELAFRGLIFSALQRVLGDREVVIVSALMFMVLHLAVPSFPHLLLIGLILGWLRLRTGSLYPGMLLHFTHNLLCVVFERQGG